MIRSLDVVPTSRMIVPGVSSVNSRSQASALNAATGLRVTMSGTIPTSASIVSCSVIFSFVTAKMPTSTSGESGDWNVW